MSVDLLPAAYNLQQIVILSIFSFILGIVIQVIGSRFSKFSVYSCPPWAKRNRSFNKFMEKGFGDTDSSCENCDDIEPITKFDEYFHECCESVFDMDIPDEFNDWERLFELLIAYLENSPWNRAVRMQTLHLATRGLYVSFLLLAVYYAVIAATFFAVNIQDEAVYITLTISSSNIILNSAVVFILMAGFTVAISYMFFLRARDFEGDVKCFIVCEFVLSVRNRGKFDPADQILGESSEVGHESERSRPAAPDHE